MCCHSFQSVNLRRYSWDLTTLNDLTGVRSCPESHPFSGSLSHETDLNYVPLDDSDSSSVLVDPVLFEVLLKELTSFE